MLLIQRTSGPDTHWYVCCLKTCSKVAKGEVAQPAPNAPPQILIPVGWCLSRRVTDPPQMAIIPAYCCPEHAMEDDGRGPPDFGRIVDLEIRRKPLDDIGLPDGRWGLR